MMDPGILYYSLQIGAIFSGFYFLYKYGTSTFEYFSSQGIAGPKPLPFVGNWWGIWRENFPKYDANLVKQYGKVFGYFDGLLPNLWVTDADMIKSIFVKDFDHFMNRRNFQFQAKVARKVLSQLRDQEWKDVRHSVTPAFTSGKIKRYSTLIKACAEKLTQKIDLIVKKDGKIDAKSFFSLFTMDVIARCAFGMTIENLGEKDDPFMTKGRNFFSPEANKSPLVLAAVVFPELLRFLGDRIFLSEDFRFFFDLMEQVIKERSKTDKKYFDFPEVATESVSDYAEEALLNGQTGPIWTREDVDEIVAAQSAIFLLAGFDTTATTLTTTCYLLAKHPEVQEKMFNQIMNKIEQFGEISHEMLMELPYVDNVIQEALRMYPPVVRVERDCTKDFTYKGIKIKKGTLITVPTFALHFMEEYYEEPNKFNPDRWEPENKKNMNPYAFIPFGTGPRSCIGMRFAMEEIKIALCSVVKQFRFFPVAETPPMVTYVIDLFSYITYIGGARIRGWFLNNYTTSPLDYWGKTSGMKVYFWTIFCL